MLHNNVHQMLNNIPYKFINQMVFLQQATLLFSVSNSYGIFWPREMGKVGVKTIPRQRHGQVFQFIKWVGFFFLF